MHIAPIRLPGLAHVSFPWAIPPTGFFRVVIDFESYYSRDISLSKMTPLEYLLHPRFECIGASIRIDTHPIGPKSGSMERPFDSTAIWIDADDLPALFAALPWERVILVSHNIGFDGALLAWRYGRVPALYVDTLGMARALVYPYTGSASLEKVAEHLGLPRKIKEVIVNALGWGRTEFLADEAMGGNRFRAYKDYCCHDSDLCAGILDRLGPQMPTDEIILCDMVARMAIQPQFVLDRDVLVAHLKSVQGAKDKLLERLRDSGLIEAPGTPDEQRKPKELMSDEKLAALLRYMGVDPPTKFSLKQNKEVYAFAKTDAEFTALQEDEDPLVQALVTARLGVKTTIEESRTERFIACADVQWTPESEGAMLAPVRAVPKRMPFPLRFSGAHTHRLSGDWKLNLQNLGRKSPLRRALRAPPGYVVVSADAAQIEARVVCWLAGAQRVLNDFRLKRDPYMRLGEIVYGAEPLSMNKKDHVIERFVGKTGVLGLGFGMGPPKFVVTCWNQGRQVIDLPLAEKTVKSYRMGYAPEVPALWSNAEYLLDGMINGVPRALGPVQTVGNRVLLPNGMWLHYNNLRKEKRPAPWNAALMVDQYVFNFGKEVNYLFGGKFVENMVQALARIITMTAALRIRKLYGISASPLAGQVHDQLIYLRPEPEAQHFLDQVLLPEMCRPLDWCSDIPLEAEGAIGYNLLDAK